MIIGIPKEVKADENRVSLTPDKVDLLVKNGHTVLVQTGAGRGAAFEDDVYDAVGASIVDDASDVFGESDMIVKVKEPQPQEYELFRKNQILFTFLHLAPEPELTRALLKSKVAGVAYETVQEPDGSLPLLYPMSEIAGRLAPQVAARLLQNLAGGPGKMMGGIPGVEPPRMVVVGGGTVGLNAALVASGMGTQVTIVDINLDRLRHINLASHGTIDTVVATPQNVTSLLQRADVAVGAVLVPGDRAPKVITSDMVQAMREQSIIIDVAIDQGGSVETIHATSHQEPTYQKFGVTHYAVPNMPGIVANTASISLSNATYTYVMKLANLGLKDAVKSDPAIAKGVNTLGGHVTYRAVADSLDLEYVATKDALAA
ncbi:MAG: alanine dehydrogenase [SAR202 cluster bacterium]|jgi:alanine dehydrogenase|nr:alanine dehydrogenase [SAR202 cluster bacterium]